MEEKIWKSFRGADSEHIKDAENILRFKFPTEFISMYSESDGIGMDIGHFHIQFWSIDSILAANDIFSEIEEGRYVFFADADDGIDSFAYDRQSDRIFVFSTEYGIDQGRYCADNIKEVIDYIRNL